EPLALLDGAEKVTVTPLTRLPPLSFTVATRGAAKAVLMEALCGVPLVAVMLAGGLAVFDKEKLAGVTTPVIVAVTVYAPTVPFAVNTAAVATPFEFVVAVFIPPENVLLALLDGEVKVTTAPLIALPSESFTVACS